MEVVAENRTQGGLETGLDRDRVEQRRPRLAALRHKHRGQGRALGVELGPFRLGLLQRLARRGLFLARGRQGLRGLVSAAARLGEGGLEPSQAGAQLGERLGLGPRGLQLGPLRRRIGDLPVQPR